MVEAEPSEVPEPTNVPTICAGQYCGESGDDVIKRQVSDTTTLVLCPECADRMRASGGQTRGSEPPEHLEKRWRSDP